MITIVEAGTADFAVIRDIAYKTWPDTYGKILSAEQLDYMLDSFYSEKALLENYTQKNHRFLLLHEDGNPLGFASYEHDYLGKKVTRLHKIYLLPESQGKGAGKLLIEAVENAAKTNQSEAISLNVNRFNNAQTFYLKHGFEIVGAEDIEIGFGYLMEDYKMEKKL
jgi:GNAT superfamily N-acetyltransferase